ncbi:hypothetical protein E3N88_32452 [Mikania micrantha]|uniref:Uncharacterized protein n=1 Tax=Mikania micrantha TaxID=192012 RepID=A0A5N6M928_9ASTR|nr:hypothetical protein E3N88_32452 [Mikania micrantha]
MSSCNGDDDDRDFGSCKGLKRLPEGRDERCFTPLLRPAAAFTIWWLVHLYSDRLPALLRSGGWFAFAAMVAGSRVPYA